MSRFSPTVLPQVPDATANFAQRFAQTLAQNQKLKEEGVAAGDTHTTSTVENILRGLRMGKAPAGGAPATPDQAYQDPVTNHYGPPSDAGVTASPGLPLAKGAPRIGDGLAEALGVGSTGLGTPQATTATKDMQRALGVGGDSLADVMSGKADATAGNGGPPTSPYSTRKMPPSIDARAGGMGGTMVAGAFDPVTGGFASAHGLPEGADQYVQIDPSHYVDTLGGSQLALAMLRSDSETQRLLANLDARRAIAAGGNASRETVAAGHDATRTSEGAANRDARAENTSTVLAGRLEQIALQNRGRAQAAGARGSRAMTARQAEITQGAQADAIVQAFDGDRAKAEDFIANDPQGQSIAKKYGLTSDHLFTAEQRYRTAASKQDAGVGKTQMAGGATPAQAAAGAAELRTRQAEAKLPDDRLWDKKVHEGMSKEDATKYVKNRNKAAASVTDPSAPPAPDKP